MIQRRATLVFLFVALSFTSSSHAQFNLGDALKNAVEKAVEEVTDAEEERGEDPPKDPNNDAAENPLDALIGMPAEKPVADQDTQQDKTAPSASENLPSDPSVEDSQSPEWIARAKDLEQQLLSSFPVYTHIFSAWESEIDAISSAGSIPGGGFFASICENEFDEEMGKLSAFYETAIGFVRCGDYADNWVKLMSWYLPSKKNYAGTKNWFLFSPVRGRIAFPQHEFFYKRTNEGAYVEPLLFSYSGDSGIPGWYLNKFRRGTYVAGGTTVRSPVFTLVANFAMLTAVGVRMGTDSGEYMEWRDRTEAHLNIASEIGETYLFADVKNAAEIAEKVESWELTAPLIRMYSSLLGNDSAYGSQTSAFIETSESFSPKSKGEREFENLYGLYYEVESCYLTRKNYALQYVTSENYSSAMSAFRSKSESMNLSEGERAKIKDEIDADRKTRRDLEVSGARYTEERNSECGFYLYSLIN